MLGQKKVAWLVRQVEEFRSAATDDPQKATQRWLHDYITQVFYQKAVLAEKRWGMFFLSLAAMHDYLQEDPQIPDKPALDSKSDFNLLQNAIVTIGLRMGRWLAGFLSPDDSGRPVARWQFCCWQKAVSGLFYEWNQKRKTMPIADLHDQQDIVDADDILPERPSIKNSRREWVFKRAQKFAAEWQQTPGPASCITLIDDFVRRMYLEDNIINKDELADRIYQLFEALEPTGMLQNNQSSRQLSVEDGEAFFVRLLFELLPVAAEMLMHLRQRPEEYMEKAYNRKGYDLGGRMFNIMNRWAIALRQAS
jgi:hypothetical protein